MISDRAKRLVEALQNWRSLELAYEIAQKFLDEEAAHAVEVHFERLRAEAFADWAKVCDAQSAMLAERIAQTRGHSGEDE